MQQIPYSEFEISLDVKVPGMSSKNTYRIFRLPPSMPPELEIAEKGLVYKANRMLNPPVNIFGIPAIRKLAKDILTWEDKTCFEHMVAYAGLTPPFVAEDLSHNDGLRFEQVRLLKELGGKYQNKAWIEASNLFTQSGNLIINLCRRAVRYDGTGCSELLKEIANVEEEAYRCLR
jgi:hypothetical protein